MRCPQYGQTLQVDASAVAVAVAEGDAVFGRDRFLLRQKALALNEKYYVWDDNGQTLLFVERPAHHLRSLLALLGAIVTWLAVFTIGMLLLLQVYNDFDDAVPFIVPLAVIAFIPTVVIGVALSPLRHVTFYRDDTRGERLLEIRQINKWQLPNAYYDLLDTDGNLLAKLKKNYLYNFIRRRWYISRPDGTMWVLAKEDSIVLSLLRRVMPEIFAAFMRTNFIIVRPDDEQVIGEFNRKLAILDRYVLDMSNDTDHCLDRRVALALGVLLDTGERR